MNDHGFVVCAYNRTTEKVDKFLANEAKGLLLWLLLEASTIYLYLIIIFTIRYKYSRS